MPPTETDPEFGYVTPENLALFADLYELTMMQGYYHQDHNPKATFSLFFRDLPPDRGYMIAAGLEQAVHAVQGLDFSERAIEYLREQGFGEDFLDYIADIEFTGEVRAIPEGTLVFANEPLVEVTAPLAQAQLFETIVINQVGYGSLIATKAMRMRDMVTRHGNEQSLVDFGSRRAHGTDAGMKAARAAYIGGFDGTSNVAAGEAFDIPTYGTMAHSWIQSFETERAAFETFVAEYGEDAILLIDTYDTITGARVARDVADEMGVDIAGVRLDSGDLTALSKEVAPIVGDDVDVFISSGVDEYKIWKFLTNGGVGDGFGPGTALVTSTDAPKVEGVYKLVAVERDGEMQPSMKLSTGKVTYPGAKSVCRVTEGSELVRDVMGLRGEDLPGDEQLVTVIEDGDLVYDLPSLDAIRNRALDTFDTLSPKYRRLQGAADYPVDISDGLQAETETLQRDLKAEYLG